MNKILVPLLIIFVLCVAFFAYIFLSAPRESKHDSLGRIFTKQIFMEFPKRQNLYASVFSLLRDIAESEHVTIEQAKRFVGEPDAVLDDMLLYAFPESTNGSKYAVITLPLSAAQNHNISIKCYDEQPAAFR